MVTELPTAHYAGRVKSQSVSEGTLPYYVVVFVRSITVLITGLVITFTPGHTAQFGLVALGIFGIVNAVGLTLSAFGLNPGNLARGLHVWQALVSLVVGALVLALNEAGMVLLLWAVVFWALLVGTAEVVFGARLPGGHILRRDWITQGAMTVLLAIIVLFTPADSVAVVGFLGAWAIVQGVYLAIAGFGLRLPPHPKDMSDE